MYLLLAVFLATLLTQGIAVRPITALSIQARELKESFNTSEDKPRLVGVFSPTCGHCLQACSEFGTCQQH